jgi:hypothetical protein
MQEAPMGSPFGNIELRGERENNLMSQSSIKYSLSALIERLQFTLSPKGYPIKLLA